MEREDTINLAIYEATPDEAEFIATELRNAGHAVKPFGYQEKIDLQEILADNRIDLILSSPDPKDLGGTVKLANDPDYMIPVVGIASDTDTASVVIAMQGGARDLVSRNQPDHLKLVIERELQGTEQCRNARNYVDAYKESEKRCRSLLDSSRDAIAYIHDGMHIYVNPVYVEMFGFEDTDDLEGLPILDMVTEEEHGRFKEFISSYGEEQQDNNVNITCVREDGTEFGAAMEFTRASIDGEACTQVIIRDQSSAVSQTVINELELLKTQDPVTGLYNRQAFIEQMEMAMTDVKQSKRPAVLFYIEIDDFDKFKSAMGMENIDEAISNIGKLIANTIDDEDFGARFGEEIFTVLTHSKDVKKIGAKAKALVSALGKVVEAGDKSMQITASLGLASVRSNVNTPYEVLACAESACSAAMEKGGNTVEAYKDPEKEAEKAASQAELRWVNLISKALEDNLLQLAFQPIVSLQEDDEEYYESLLRLNDENGEEILPGDFLPAAEKTGMISKIDRWVVARALHLLAEQQRSGRQTSLFVKLSDSAIRDEGILPWLYERTKASKVDPSRLIIEINERSASAHINQYDHFCRTLKKMKSQVVLSQFGIGDQPFKLLKSIPVDFLRVDSELTSKISSDPNMMNKLIEIVQQGHELDKRVIAPNVENAESMAMLFQCGFDFIQGNFLQEPDIVMQFDFGENEASMHRSQVAVK